MREVLGDLWEPLASRWRQAEANMIKDGAISGPLMATEAEAKADGEKISDQKNLEAEKKS